MNIDRAVEQVLERYMPRVQVKPGNGLSKNMNSSLRSYDQIPTIIARTVSHLASLESLFDFSGAIRLDTMNIYKNLMDLHDDWVTEVPRMGWRSKHEAIVDSLMEAPVNGELQPLPKARGTVDFHREPLLPFHQFTAAWTIARRIGVVEGRGEIGLSRSVLADLKRLAGMTEPAAS